MRHGFVARPPFADYLSDPNSTYLALSVTSYDRGRSAELRRMGGR